MSDVHHTHPEVNKYQTPFDELGIDDAPQSVQDQFWDFYDRVPYIQRLTAVDRPRAKDLPRDSEGKIFIDVTHPHILENMDYFRQAALYYKQNGTYCPYKPNPNPNSSYMKWFAEETRRCWYGMVRPSDGEWITGDYYFFLNYFPMNITENDGKSKRSRRVIGFPSVWEIHYLKSHYIYQAREQGHHFAELASRGKGKSAFAAAMLAKRFLMGEDEKVTTKVISYITADDKKYLVQSGDQTLDKFKFVIDFLAQRPELQWPRQKLINTIDKMQWQMGYKDLNTGANRGTLNSVIGVSSKDDEAKLRGSRGVLYLMEESGSFSRLLELYNNLRPSVEEGDQVYGQIGLYGCVCAGTMVWTRDGRNIPIECLHQADGIIGCDTDSKRSSFEDIENGLIVGYKPCLEITYGRRKKKICCSTDHPFFVAKASHPRLNKEIDGRTRDTIYKYSWKRADELKKEDLLVELREISSFGNDTLEDARLIGMLIGDGSYGYDNSVRYYSEDKELQEYVTSRYDTSIIGGHTTLLNREYVEYRIRGICKMLRAAGIYGQTKSRKRLPTKYETLNRENTILLLSGLYDTDGCIYYKKGKKDQPYISITQASIEIIRQIESLWMKFGVRGSIITLPPKIAPDRKDKNTLYAFSISSPRNLLKACSILNLLIKRKQESLSIIVEQITFTQKQRGIYIPEEYIFHDVYDIEDIGMQGVYNLTATNTHTYLANNLITHNTAGDSESDFRAFSEIIYNPQAYNVLAVENIYDIVGQGRKETTYFSPAYVNRAGAYDENGNSDVTKALFQLMMARWQIRSRPGVDPKTVTNNVAQLPVTPQEAMMRTSGSIFPVHDLTQRLNQLLQDPSAMDGVAVGTLVMSSGGAVEFTPTDDDPIVEFPLRDNKARGALQIFSFPQKDSNGRVPRERYGIGLDPADSDDADTLSLTSIFVLDFFTDTIAAEYTGRMPFADDAYELARKLCLFYNCKILYENNIKGTYSYFLRMGCTHLLAETPEYLAGKDIATVKRIGNTKYGVTATLPVNNYANSLLRDWLLKPFGTVVKDKEGNEQEVVLPNLYRLKNIALIRELVAFNPNINVDRVRAMGIAMLYREEKVILYGGTPRPPEGQERDSGYLGADDFFSRNYDRRFRKHKEG